MKNPPEASLTPAQFEILQAAWSVPTGASVAEIWEAVATIRPVTRTTVLNLVDRLEKRGWFARRKVDGVFRYTPTVDRETAASNVAAEFVDAFFSGSASELVMSLVGSKRISPEEIEHLRKLLDHRGRTSNS